MNQNHHNSATKKSDNPVLTRYHSVQWRIMMRQFPLVMIIALATLIWLEQHLRKAVTTTHLEFAKKSSLLIISALQATMKSATENHLWNDFSRRIPVDNDMQFEIINNQGNIVFTTNNQSHGKKLKMTDALCATCHMNNLSSGEMKGKFVPDTGNHPFQVLAVPLQNSADCFTCHSDKGAKLGMVFIRKSSGSLHELIRTTQLGLILAGLVVIIVILISTRWLLARFLNRPLNELVKGAQRIGAGILNEKIHLPENTELTILANTFNSSADQLAHNIKKIEDQRDFVITLYRNSNNLFQSIDPQKRRILAMQLIGNVLNSPCVLFSTQSQNSHSDHQFDEHITFFNHEKDISDYSYSEFSRKSPDLSFYSPIFIDQWRQGKLKGFAATTQVDDKSALVYPLLRNEKEFGIILTPGNLATSQLKDEKVETTDNFYNQNEFRLQLAVSIITIILEFSELQQEFIRQERLAVIGETVAGLSHCLKNTLNGLRGGQYVVESAMKKNHQERMLQGWEVLKGGISHIERLALDMLYFAGDRKPHLELINPHEILQEVIDLLTDSALKKGITLTAEFAQAMPEIPLDRLALYRVILNLVTNAIDACLESEQGNQVILKSEINSEKAVLIITDNGIGMSESTRQRMFDRFFTTKLSKGTGLGLPVVKKIIESHNGSIRVESALGKGTSFYIYLKR